MGTQQNKDGAKCSSVNRRQQQHPIFKANHSPQSLYGVSVLPFFVL